MLIKHIYIRLLGEGTDVWVPVKAVEVGVNLFRIIGNNESNSGDENIEFKPGEVVECEMQTRSIGNALVAVRLAQKH